MKTKAQTKQIKQARQNKQAAQMSTGQKTVEYIKTGVFFAVPVLIVVLIFVVNGVKSFNAF